MADNSFMKLPDPGIDVTKAPQFWMTKPDEVLDFLERLPGVVTKEIGKTYGKREIYAAEWGRKEAVSGKTSCSLSSAYGARKPEAFFGTGKRERCCILFVGASHGTEFEGTAAALNFLSILSTGKDLLERPRPDIAQYGDSIRFLFIPFLNVDGRQRLADHVSWIGCNLDYFYAVSQGVTLDGEILSWPKGKQYMPMPELAVLGSYYNDAGVNLVYDVAMAGDSQPETTAIVRYLREELPDCTIFSHSDKGSLVMEAGAFIPIRYKLKVNQIAALVGMGCHKAGYSQSRIPSSTINYAGEILYQDDIAYHASGTLPLLVEFPHGLSGDPATHEDILDIGLIVLDEIIRYGLRYGFRPKSLGL